MNARSRRDAVADRITQTMGWTTTDFDNGASIVHPTEGMHSASVYFGPRGAIEVRVSGYATVTGLGLCTDDAAVAAQILRLLGISR